MVAIFRTVPQEALSRLVARRFRGLHFLEFARFLDRKIFRHQGANTSDSDHRSGLVFFRELEADLCQVLENIAIGTLQGIGKYHTVLFHIVVLCKGHCLDVIFKGTRRGIPRNKFHYNIHLRIILQTHALPQTRHVRRINEILALFSGFPGNKEFKTDVRIGAGTIEDNFAVNAFIVIDSFSQIIAIAVPFKVGFGRISKENHFARSSFIPFSKTRFDTGFSILANPHIRANVRRQSLNAEFTRRTRFAHKDQLHGTYLLDNVGTIHIIRFFHLEIFPRCAMAFFSGILHVQAHKRHILIYRRTCIVCRIEANFHFIVRLVRNAQAVTALRKVGRRAVRVRNIIGDTGTGRAFCT